jgi:hypothetical protein
MVIPFKFLLIILSSFKWVLRDFYNTSIAKHTKVDMIWVAGRSPTLVSHSLRGVATNLKATTLAYLAILPVCRLLLSLHYS